MGAPESEGSHRSVPSHRRVLGPDLDRHLPVEDLRRLLLVLDLRRRGLRHVVDAVVVPLVAAGAIHQLPLWAGRVAGARWDVHLGKAVLVEVVRRRALVHLHGPVGQDPDIGLAPVAVDHQVLAAAVGRVEPIVVVVHLELHARHEWLDPRHLGAEVRIAGVRPGRRWNQQHGREREQRQSSTGH